jgi:hypothetical protein
MRHADRKGLSAATLAVGALSSGLSTVGNFTFSFTAVFWLARSRRSQHVQILD